ncbi:MAG: S9 family peptidase [bacterium]
MIRLSGTLGFSFALILSVLATGFASPGDSLRIPSIETFMQIGSATGPQVSRDGSSILFLSSMAGVSQVYVLTESGWPYQLTAFTDGIDFYRISPNGNMVVVGASKGGNEQSDLYLVDLDSRICDPLLENQEVRYGSPLWSKDELMLYFSSNEENKRDLMVYEISIRDRNIRRIFDMQGWNSAVAISNDGNKILVERYTSNMNNDLYLVDLYRNETTLLTPHKDDYIFNNARLLPDGSKVFCITNMNAEGLRKIASIDVATLRMEFLGESSPWEVEEMEVSPDGGYLAWVENIEGYGKPFLMDLATMKKMEISLPGGIVSDLSLSNDLLLFTFNSPSKPPDVWCYQISNGNLRKITFSTLAGIDPSLFVEPKLVRYESFDGLSIPAFLYVPPNWDGDPIPFVIEAHGGPESQFRPSFIRHFHYLILNGYGVLAPNIRGSSGYGREYVRMDDYKKRKDSIKDIGAAAQWLIENGYTTGGKIAIKGQSYGGYVTLASLVEFPDLFGAGIDHVGIANFVTFLKNTAEYRRTLREAEYGPLSDEDFLKEISPINSVDKIKAPLLIVHGENDPRVPVGEARQMADELKKRGREVELMIFPDEGHGIAKLENRLIYYRKMVEFLDKHIK